ncbi:MAG TPA: CpsB/CapC family capsule biosynthesis tyrosine phosphatase [Solirubrobacteraceae bacterium]
MRITGTRGARADEAGEIAAFEFDKRWDGFCRTPFTADTHVDLQFHVLPCIDDGPATLEQSPRIADLAVRDGTRLAVATPHVRSDHLLASISCTSACGAARGSVARLTTPPTTTAGDQPYLPPAADRIAHGRPLHRV